MFLLDWYEKYLEIREAHMNPHVCDSCETLKSQLAFVNHEKEVLLSRVMEKPEKEPERVKAPEMQYPINVARMPWRVRQQMLEQNDREKARAIREAPKPDTTEITKKEQEEFENEVANAEAAREKAKS